MMLIRISATITLTYDTEIIANRKQLTVIFDIFTHDGRSR